MKQWRQAADRVWARHFARIEGPGQARSKTCHSFQAVCELSTVRSVTAFPRSWLLPCATVAYVAFASWSATTGPLRWVALFGLPALVYEVWRRTSQKRQTGLLPTAVAPVQATAWGAALFLAARTGPVGRAAYDAAANLGAGATVVAALVSMAYVASPHGLLSGHRAARSRDAAGFAALLWGIAVAMPATRAIVPEARVLDPLSVDYATTAAGVGSLLLLAASAGRMILLRGLELGVGERARGALTLSIAGALVAVAAAALDVAAPDRVVPAVLTTTAALVTWATATRDSTTVTSVMRGLLAVILLGVPTALLTLWIAQQSPEHLGVVVLVGCQACVLVGLIARAVARPLGPEGSRWIGALETAMDRALLPEPEAALRAALAELRRAEPTADSVPELWRRDPPAILRVDVAGYLHEQAADFPERILELAVDEPERTLRSRTLRALQVRRPELRSLLAWFESHRAHSVTALLDTDGPVGLLVMPRGARRAVLTLEEVRALRALADRLSGLLSVSSSMARSRQRELVARREAETSERKRQELENNLEAEGRRRTAEAASFADPLRVTAHGPAARFTLERLEHEARSNTRFVLVVPNGVDVRGWAAAIHLASPRSAGPFVRVDCASARSRSVEAWEHPHASPLGRAAGGSLLIEDPSALPLEVQEFLARSLQSDGDCNVIVASSSNLEALESNQTVSSALVRQLRGPEITLPSLAERAEDLQSLVLSELSGAGLRRGGQPLGVAPPALKLLTEHDWPGNDLELRAVLRSAASRARSNVVTAEDLLASGLREPVIDEAPTPVPAEQPRRRTRRAPRSRSY